MLLHQKGKCLPCVARSRIL
ncbi:hypothetical protein A2U01_0086183, partial [Trifolium medium]|nr:hypothetical protein [Trifolium medium]